MEGVRVELRGATASQDLVAEEDEHLGNVIVAGNQKGAQEVFPTIASGLEDRYLSSSKHYWFVKVLQHKG